MRLFPHSNTDVPRISESRPPPDLPVPPLVVPVPPMLRPRRPRPPPPPAEVPPPLPRPPLLPPPTRRLMPVPVTATTPPPTSASARLPWSSSWAALAARLTRETSCQPMLSCTYSQVSSGPIIDTQERKLLTRLKSIFPRDCRTL